MRRFEYKAIRVEGNDLVKEAERRFNNLGREGWQVFWIVPGNVLPTYIWVMREIDD